MIKRSWTIYRHTTPNMRKLESSGYVDPNLVVSLCSSCLSLSQFQLPITITVSVAYHCSWCLSLFLVPIAITVSVTPPVRTLSLRIYRGSIATFNRQSSHDKLRIDFQLTG
jgi:hypothetical protein